MNITWKYTRTRIRRRFPAGVMYHMTPKTRVYGIPDGCFLPDFLVEYRVQHLGDDGTDGPVIGWYPLEEKPNAKILVLRYLTEGGAAPSTGKFLTYREIPWGEVYFKQFQEDACSVWYFGFGGKLDKFREIMERVGAQAISSGDVGYELEFMKGLLSA